MSEYIGKLLWNKAERTEAMYHPDGMGVVVITVPAIFDKNYKSSIDLSARILMAVVKHIKKTDPHPDFNIAVGEGIATGDVSFQWATPYRAEVTITIKTQYLEIWQWISNHRYGGNIL